MWASAATGVIGAAEERFGGVGLLVNNAGASLHRPAQETSVENI
jgi:NADP-dependent 3-hydroxy acid dehydrogenase YdfG